MALKPISSARRRNVTPTSSILRIVTRDVDCSAFAFAPEDGQFVVTAGDIATNPGDDANTTFFTDANATPGATDLQGSSLKMVWSSALQTDRQALGNTKVPVLWLGGVEVECKLLNANDNGNNPAAFLALNDSTNYPAGKLVSVKQAGAAVQGSADRLIITPMGDGQIGWAVGYVTKTTSDLAAADKFVTIMLYDQPRKVGSF